LQSGGAQDRKRIGARSLKAVRDKLVGQDRDAHPVGRAAPYRRNKVTAVNKGDDFI